MFTSKKYFVPTVLALLLVGATLFFWQQGALAQDEPQQNDPVRQQQALAASLGTAISYQGSLSQLGNPATGSFTFELSLFDAATGGNQVGTTQTFANVNVTNGVFSIPALDFGAGAFNGEARFLAITVNGQALSPRQELKPVPNALSLPGLYTKQTSGTPNIIGGFTGNSVGTGKVGATVSGGGTSFSPNSATNDYATVGGGQDNTASGGNATVGGGNRNTASDSAATVGGGDGNEASGFIATIAGGTDNTASGSKASIGGGDENQATGDDTTVAGGSENTASGSGAFVGGGEFNRATAEGAMVGGGGGNLASNNYATVSGGSSNTANGVDATVSGGRTNQASATSSTVAGGNTNKVYDDYGTISGGQNNIAGVSATAATAETHATIGGGSGNTASGSTATIGGGSGNTASDSIATVGGGDSNTASGYITTVGGGDRNTASGSKATVGGGSRNVASGSHSFVGGGDENEANGSESTVAGGYGNIANGGESVIGGGTENETTNDYATISGGFLNRATGASSTIPGGSNNTASGASSFAAGNRANAQHQGAFVWSDTSGSPGAASTANNQFMVRASGGTIFYSNSTSTTGVSLAAGSGAWSALSDRNVKANVEVVNGREVLNQLANIPIATWNYTSQDESIRHIGPMAQDFQAAFAVGEDETRISTIDADGVALAAIQGLNDIVTEQESEIEALEAQIERLETAVQAQSSPQANPFNWLLLSGIAAFWLFSEWRRRQGGQA
ncbi:MAG: tail fiber domain-containing protein [Chloroflexota bacterium]